jgi:hypothetical protein
MNPSHSSGATFSFCRPWCKGKFRQLFLLAALWPLWQNHPGRSNGGWYQRKALPGKKFPQTLAPPSSGSSTVQRFPQADVQITTSGCASTWTSATNTATPPPCPPAWAPSSPTQIRAGPPRSSRNTATWKPQFDCAITPTTRWQPTLHRGWDGHGLMANLLARSSGDVAVPAPVQGF